MKLVTYEQLEHAIIREWLERKGYVKQGSTWSEISSRTNRAFLLLKATLKPGRPRKREKLQSNPGLSFNKVPVVVNSNEKITTLP